MPIHTILGKPGSGKSLYATTLVIRQLVDGNKNIVTNLPLHPGRLNEYLQEKYPAVDCRMPQRLRLLTDDELRRFWEFRGPFNENEVVAEPPRFEFVPRNGEGRVERDARFAAEHRTYTQQMGRYDLAKMVGDLGGDSKGTLGVYYFLDECHIAFNARDWATIGRGALHYLSQHRKMGDTVFPITQAPGNLDKQFRSVTEDFTVLRNMATAKFGPFRGSAKFTRKTYLKEPGNDDHAVPFETASFTLDKEGIASCYDTARGIGVHGSAADIGRRAKGWPAWTIFPLALAGGSLCVFVPWILAKGTNKFVTGGVAEKVAEVKKMDARVSAGLQPVAGALTGGPGPPVKPPPEQVFCTGYVVRGRDVQVTLSDGRILGPTEVLRINRAFVETTEGKFFMQKARSVPPPSKPQPQPETTAEIMSTYKDESVQPTGDRGVAPENFEKRGVPNRPYVETAPSNTRVTERKVLTVPRGTVSSGQSNTHVTRNLIDR